MIVHVDLHSSMPVWAIFQLEKVKLPAAEPTDGRSLGGRKLRSNVADEQENGPRQCFTFCRKTPISYRVNSSDSPEMSTATNPAQQPLIALIWKCLQKCTDANGTHKHTHAHGCHNETV